MRTLQRSSLALLATTLLTSVSSAAMANDEAGARSSAGFVPGAVAMAAQSASSAPDAEEFGDIVVTARRVSESLSKVPLAVTAMDSEQLAARAVLAETDLQRSFAGLTVRTGQTSNLINFSIRGQSIDLFTGSQPGVLPYFNEVQLSSYSSSGFYDLESIQALKGPQGTLFGRNATGGAVLFSTGKPTNDFGGSITGRIGNYDLRQVQGFINVPLIEDKVLLRVAGDLQRRDGYQFNVLQNRAHGKVDRESGRVSLTLKPTDRLSNDFVFQYSKARGDNVSLQTYNINACGTPVVFSTAACVFSPIVMGPAGYAAYQAAHPGTEFMPNGFIDQEAYQRQLGHYKVNSRKPNFHRATDWFLTNSTAFELSDAITLKNIIGFGKAKSYDSYDAEGDGPYFIQNQDATPSGQFTGNLIGVWNDVKNFSEEFQIIGKTDTLDYIAGVYYSSEKRGFFAPVSFFELAPLGQGPLGAAFGIPQDGVSQQIVQINDFKTSDVSTAVYAQATKDLSDMGLEGVKLTGGIRYTWETFKSDLRERSSQLFFLNSPINPPSPNEKVKNKKPSWNVSIDYQASNALLLYFAHRGSWRTGGINAQGPARPFLAGQGGNIFKPETTYDFEVGMKYAGRVGGAPVRANLAVYNQIIKNVQRVIYTQPPAEFAVGGVPALQALTVNIPKARVRGFEFDLAANPVDWLEVGGSLTHTDAKFINGTTLLFGGLQTYGTYADTPKWAATLYAAVTAKLGNNMGEVSLRGDLYNQSSQWFTNQGTTLAPEARFKGYTLINARLDWKDIAGSPVSAALFAKNLNKEKYYTGGIALVPFGIDGAIPAEPRMYGVEATVRF